MALAASVAMLAGTAACSDDSSDGLPAPASPRPEVEPSPTSALSPEDAEAAEEILAAFDSYMNAYIELSTEGVPGGTDETMDRLDEVQVSSEAFDELVFEVLNPNFQAGHATAGTITWEAEVVEIDWENTFRADPDNAVPEATVLVCFDETDWTTIDQETGEVVDGPGHRYQSTVTAHWRDEDPDRPDWEAWWEVTAREDGPEPC